MPYRIKSIRLQGIRGFNKSEEITIGDNVTLLYGENGSGKSSLLQAIEWAMTGSIPYMRGGDFTREDAIVNLFTRSKKASVELSLQNEGTPMALKRTRKMGTKTASGKQPLELKVGDKTLTEDEAETELERIIDISLTGFPQNKYLHQETLREILQAKPEERTQEIDKLLGTYEVREFAKTMDQDLQINKAMKHLTETIEALNREKIQFLINLRRSLEDVKQSLLARGHTEEELTLAAALKSLEQAHVSIKELAGTYGIVSKPIDIEPNAQSLIEAQKEIQNQINTLERSRHEAIIKIDAKKNRLQTDSTRYRDVYESFQGMKDLDSVTINSRINLIDEELNEISAQIREIRQKLNTLPHKRTSYETTKADIEEKQGELKQLIEKYGTFDEIEKKIKDGLKKLKEIDGELEKLSGQQHLITLAIDFLEETKADKCPVCFQGIEPENLIKELKVKVGDEITKKIKQLKEAEKEAKAERIIFDEALKEQNRITRFVSDLEIALNKAAEEMRKLVPDFEQLDMDEVVKNWEKEITHLSGRETELRSEQSGLRSTLTKLTDLLAELKQLQTNLQKETFSSAEGLTLIGKVKDLMNALEGDANKYRDSTQIDSLRKTLSPLSDVISYIRDEERLDAAEKELPTVQKQIDDLEARKSSLQVLTASLQSIRQIATQYEKEASITQLKRLEDEINNYYTKIQGHPHFTRLKVDIEKEDPLIFSFRAASDQEDTYIPTRFSTAQLNAAALSIFMSNSSQTAGELPIMILDDPTQSMDTPHKEAFAKLVATLTPRHQVIVATEDDETRRFLMQYCKGIKTYELANWTTEGPQIRAGKDEDKQ